MKRKKYNWIIYLIIILYLGLYITNRSGYFEYSNYNKKIVTEEKIKQFENDIKENKNIDVSSYIEKPVNYQTKLSKLTLETSDFISKLARKSITESIKFINKMIE